LAGLLLRSTLRGWANGAVPALRHQVPAPNTTGAIWVDRLPPLQGFLFIDDAVLRLWGQWCERLRPPDQHHQNAPSSTRPRLGFTWDFSQYIGLRCRPPGGVQGDHHLPENDPLGETRHQPCQRLCHQCLRVEVQGSRVTSDAGLGLVRDLDERLGLTGLIRQHLGDSRPGRHAPFPLPELFRQSVDSRLSCGTEGAARALSRATGEHSGGKILLE
jgi:hypothetical protein